MKSVWLSINNRLIKLRNSIKYERFKFNIVQSKIVCRRECYFIILLSMCKAHSRYKKQFGVFQFYCLLALELRNVPFC